MPNEYGFIAINKFTWPTGGSGTMREWPKGYIIIVYDLLDLNWTIVIHICYQHVHHHKKRKGPTVYLKRALTNVYVYKYCALEFCDGAFSTLFFFLIFRQSNLMMMYVERIIFRTHISQLKYVYTYLICRMHWNDEILFKFSSNHLYSYSYRFLWADCLIYSSPYLFDWHDLNRKFLFLKFDGIFMKYDCERFRSNQLIDLNSIIAFFWILIICLLLTKNIKCKFICEPFCSPYTKIGTHTSIMPSQRSTNLKWKINNNKKQRDAVPNTHILSKYRMRNV